MKAVVAAFNQEKALVGAFSVITNLRMGLFEAPVDNYNPSKVVSYWLHFAPHSWCERCVTGDWSIISWGDRWQNWSCIHQSAPEFCNWDYFRFHTYKSIYSQSTWFWPIFVFYNNSGISQPNLMFSSTFFPNWSADSNTHLNFENPCRHSDFRDILWRQVNKKNHKFFPDWPTFWWLKL